MSSKVPVSRQTAWISLIPHLIVMGLIGLAVNLFYDNVLDIIFYTAVLYVVLSLALRRIIAKDHNKGILLVKKKNYKDAIPCFQASYDFFTKYKWVDKYRYLVLLSSSAISYREMSLCNIAFCYGQLGDLKKSKSYYIRALEEFPNSGLASAALKFFKAEETED